MVIGVFISLGVLVVGLLVLFVGNLMADRSTRERWQFASLVWIVPAVIGFAVFGIGWTLTGPDEVAECAAQGRFWIDDDDKNGPGRSMCVDEQQYKIIFGRNG